MVRLTALFGHPEDLDAFEDYYANTHIPIVEAMPNLQRFERARVLGTPDGSPPPYYRTADLFFENMGQLQESLATPEGQRAAQDLQSFATGGVTLFISEL